MMRVLHATGSIAERQGGPSAALIGLALAQRRQGLEVSVLTNNHNDARPRMAVLRAAGVEVITIPRPNGAGRLARHPSTQVAAAVRDNDVLHVHGVWEHLAFEAATAATRARVPYVIRPCGMLDAWALRRRPFRKKLYLAWRLRRMLEQAAAIHCTTRMEALSTAELSVQFPAIIIEPNGVAIDEFEPLPARGGFRAAHAIGDRPLIVFLGRVHPGKGVEYLLPALRLLRTSDAVAAIVGPADSAFAAQLKQQAATTATTARVIFTGLLAGPERIAPLVDADVVALPSEHENFGVAVIEALAAGCPVVVSDHVGIGQEIIAEGVGSVTSLDPASIAAALDNWLSRRNDITRPFEAARRFALEAFDWQCIAMRWQSHYERLCAITTPGIK
jgi:glycosyltransferase involved in cell wall biosynthesis